MNEPCNERNKYKWKHNNSFLKNLFFLFPHPNVINTSWRFSCLGLRMVSYPEAMVIVILLIYYSLNSDGSPRPWSSRKICMDIWTENDSPATTKLADPGACFFFLSFFFPWVSMMLFLCLGGEETDILLSLENSLELCCPLKISKPQTLTPSVQFSSATQSCPTLWDPMDCITPGLPVHHQLLELAQTHVHWVGDAIQPSHPLSSPSPPTFNLCQDQGLFKWVISLHQVAKVLESQLQHQSFQWIFRTDFLTPYIILNILVATLKSKKKLLNLI